MLKEISEAIEQAVTDRQIIKSVCSKLGCGESDILDTIEKIKTQAPSSNPEHLITEIRDMKDLVNDISHEYQGVFDETQQARDTLDYIASELDSMYSLENRFDDLITSLKQEEQEADLIDTGKAIHQSSFPETPAVKTPAVKTLTNNEQ